MTQRYAPRARRAITALSQQHGNDNPKMQRLYKFSADDDRADAYSLRSRVQHVMSKKDDDVAMLRKLQDDPNAKLERKEDSWGRLFHERSDTARRLNAFAAAPPQTATISPRYEDKYCSSVLMIGQRLAHFNRHRMPVVRTRSNSTGRGRHFSREHPTALRGTC